MVGNVTTKLEVLQMCIVVVIRYVFTVWKHQLDCLWRVGLHPRALANTEGDSIPWELGLLAVRRGVAHRRAQGKGNKSSQGRGH